jgi:phage I-like protein
MPIATGYAAWPLDGQAAPDEFRVFPKGTFEADGATYVFDDRAARDVLAEFKKHGTEKFIDYRHQSLDPYAPPEGGKAAAWFSLEVRDGELWATKVRWVKPALAALEAKEWRYISPAFRFDPKTGRVLKLVNVGLTNLPAIGNQTPLVAAQAQLQREVTKMTVERLAQALRASTDVGEPELWARVERQRDAVGQLCKLTSKDAVDDALEETQRWREQAGRLAKLEAENEELRTRVTLAELSAEIDKAVADGAPIDAKRKAHLMELGVLSRKLFDAELVLLRDAAPVAQPLPATQAEPPVATLQQNLRPLPRPAPRVADTVDDSFLARIGFSREEYAKAHEAMKKKGAL